MAFAVRQFGLDRRAVLDLGCGSGEHLRYFGSASVGLELNPGLVERARGTGLDVRRWNFVDGIPPALHGRFDAIWCSNVLEHVLAPHEFLIDTRSALRPGGLLIVVVPITRPFRLGAWGGFLAADHVNFFTLRTLRLTVQRAGYDVRYLGAFSLSRASRRVGRWLTLITPGAMAAASLIDGFQYPEKSLKQLRECGITFDPGAGVPRETA
ncbi:MAG: methyltransferase domain-containing protein [Actinomycetota bacterium]